MKFDVLNRASGKAQFTADINCEANRPRSWKLRLAVQWAIKTKATLSEADLSEANLSRADLSRATLSGANLSGADLSEVDLSEATLSGADLLRADLSGANLNKILLAALKEWESATNHQTTNLSPSELVAKEKGRAVIAKADGKQP